MKVCVLKYDHFENIHRLDPKLPIQEGAPNFRQVEELKRENLYPIFKTD